MEEEVDNFFNSGNHVFDIKAPNNIEYLKLISEHPNAKTKFFSINLFIPKEQFTGYNLDINMLEIIKYLLRNTLIYRLDIEFKNTSSLPCIRQLKLDIIDGDKNITCVHGVKPHIIFYSKTSDLKRKEVYDLREKQLDESFLDDGEFCLEGLQKMYDRFDEYSLVGRDREEVIRLLNDIKMPNLKSSNENILDMNQKTLEIIDKILDKINHKVMP